MSAELLLQARGLVKCYGHGMGATNVLDGLELDLARGEIVAIIGRSGSGKSTLLNVIGQMDRAEHGRLVLLGQDTATWQDPQQTAFRRAHLGFVFQSFNLLPTLTVRENIALPLELNGLAQEPRVSELIAALGLSAVAARFPDQVSGGEQQRTAIARALAHRPALVIADEPTGNLDADTGAEVIRLFEQAARDTGAALLMATHSADMLGHADRVFALVHGRLQAVAR